MNITEIEYRFDMEIAEHSVIPKVARNSMPVKIPNKLRRLLSRKIRTKNCSPFPQTISERCIGMQSNVIGLTICGLLLSATIASAEQSNGNGNSGGTGPAPAATAP